MNRLRLIFAPSFIATVVFATGPASAADLSFTANLTNTCILAVVNQGTLVATTDGKTLSSEASGGVAATMSVVAVGLNPTIKFTAPTLQSPAGWTGSPTTAIRYQSTGGANQAYTSAATNAPIGSLIDLFTVNSKVDSATGFISGQYVVRTTVTCQQ